MKMRFWSAWRLGLAACLLAVAPLTTSQQPPEPQGSPAFRAGSDLVLVPAVVTDASGKYVRDLRREDFIVREDGKEQKLAVFEPMLAASPPAPVRPQPRATFTNALVDQAKPGHLIILVLDTLSTSLEDQGYARAEMLRFVQTARPGAPMALVSPRRTEIKLLHDFTTDPKDLVAALEKDDRMPPVVQQSDIDEVEKLRKELEHAELCGSTRVESQAFEGCNELSGRESWRQKVRELTYTLRGAESHLAQMRGMAILQTLDSFQLLAHAFAGVPGRKSLVWASAGFPFSVGAAEMAVRKEWFSSQGLLDLYPWYQRTWQVMNDANMALYTVDARGLVSPQYNSPRTPGAPTSDSISRAAARHDDRLATMQIFAQMTGGLAFYNRNDLDAAFAGAVEDNASYYLLGYYRNRKESKPGWRKLKVEVKAASVRVRARSGFFVDEKSLSPETSRAGDLELAMRSPLDYTGLKLEAAVRNTEDRGASQRVTFRIKLSDAGVLDAANDNHFVLQYSGLATTADGKVAAQFSNTFEGRLTPENARSVASIGMHYDVPIDLAPGQYKLRFVVRDNLRGILGSVSGPFTVPYTPPPTSGLPTPSQPSPSGASGPTPPQPSLASVSGPAPSQPSPAVASLLPAPPQPAPPASASRREVSPAPPPHLELPIPTKSDVSTSKWGPPGIDQATAAITRGVTCPQGQVLHEAGQRLTEMANNISQFDAIEEVIHEEQDQAGKARFRHRSKFAYLATIARPRPGVLKIEEDRQSLFGAPGGGFPGGIATLGLPSLALAFHPNMRDSFEMDCEGLGQWQGQPAWIVRFRQREESPNYLQSYSIGGKSHMVALQGRTWISAATFNIVHMEAELVRPMPQIQLLKHHQVVDYGAVNFNKDSGGLWLPIKAELYFHFRGHRYYRRHSFDNFRLFSVDVSQKVKLPPAPNPQ